MPINCSLRLDGRRVLLAALAAFVVFSPRTGAAADRYAAIVQDLNTGQPLFSKAADERRFPASLTKMMTLYVLFGELERGRLQLASPLTVSAQAATQPPTKLGLKAGSTIPVEDAIRALVTRSANDVATTVAENVAGSEPAFAERMTQAARSLGMARTQFRNASGLPDPEQYSTARDMMILGAALQSRFPQYYGYFRTRSFVFRGRPIRSHNRLLGRIEGVDGIKTGYIRASGFNLVSSVRREGRAVVAVVMGGQTAKGRDRHMEGLITSYLPKAQSAAAQGRPSGSAHQTATAGVE